MIDKDTIHLWLRQLGPGDPHLPPRTNCNYNFFSIVCNFAQFLFQRVTGAAQLATFRRVRVRTCTCVSAGSSASRSITEVLTFLTAVANCAAGLENTTGARTSATYSATRGPALPVKHTSRSLYSKSEAKFVGIYKVFVLNFIMKVS